MTRHIFRAVAVAAVGSMISKAAPTGGSAIIPNVAETSHASQEAADFFYDFFTAKTTDDGPGLLKLYNPNQATYYDSTLGVTIAANRSQLETNIGGIEQRWAQTAPNDKSYPLRILGDKISGAVVYFVDTPGLFGAEVRTMSTFDFINGTVSRQVDNWDGRGNQLKANTTADIPYPNLGLPGLEEKATNEMKVVTTRLGNALSTNDAVSAAALFSYDTIFEDLTFRVRVEGKIAIESYLQRVLPSLPYGPGAEITHVLGNDRGGGYEWRPTLDGVRYGITALELDCNANITRFTAVWDGSQLNQTFIQGLASLGPTP